MNGRHAPRGEGKYTEAYRESISDPATFWGRAADELHWYRRWDRVLDDGDSPFCRWFLGGRTNLCYNALDRHVLSGAADRAALIWESASQGKTETITYGELLRRVSCFAAALRELGIEKGDRVAVYLPQVPEAVIAMLACARIGAIHVVIFTGYGVDSLARRLADSQPKALVTADGALRRSRALPLKDIADRALEQVPVDHVVVLDRGLVDVTMQPGRDLLWSDLTRDCDGGGVEVVPLESRDPLYILYTAGATGAPKGVVRDTGGYMVALHNSMKQIFDCREGDVFWAASDIGWVVGHSYTVYGPLLCGITSLLFEGTPDYPDHSTMWRVLEKHGVTIWFTAPTAMRMLNRFGIDRARRTDLGRLRYLFLAGEILDVPTYHWSAEAVNGVPVLDNYWLTESGWPVVAYPAGVEALPARPGSAGRPVPGYDLAVVDGEGKPLPAGAKGLLVARAPLPPGNIMTVWQDDERYLNEYWRQFPGEGVFATGDYAVADDEGYLRLLGRCDDVLNVAAHRLSIGEIEGVLRSYPAVADACVVGVADAIKGEEPAALVVLKTGNWPEGHLRAEIKNHIRERIGAVAIPRTILFVPCLPRTADGRFMRNLFRAVCERRDLSAVTIAEEGATPEEVARAARQMAGAAEQGSEVRR